MTDKTMIKDDNKTETAGSSMAGQDISTYSELVLNNNGTENRLILEVIDNNRIIEQSDNIIKTYMAGLSKLAAEAPEAEQTGSI